MKSARSTLISRGDTPLLVRPTPNNHAKQRIYNREANSKFNGFEVISMCSRSHLMTDLLFDLAPRLVRVERADFTWYHRKHVIHHAGNTFGSVWEVLFGSNLDLVSRSSL